MGMAFLLFQRRLSHRLRDSSWRGSMV